MTARAASPSMQGNNSAVTFIYFFHFVIIIIIIIGGGIVVYFKWKLFIARMIFTPRIKLKGNK